MTAASAGTAHSALQMPWGTMAPNPAARAIVWLSRNTLLGRGGMRKLMFRAFSVLHPGPADAELWGTRVRLHPAINVVERKALLRPDHADKKEHALLTSIMKRPGACFVDVGGNAGLYSLSAALAAKGPARILMIEPDEALISRLKFNLQEGRAAGKIGPDVAVETFPIAISDHAGTAFLSQEGDEGSRMVVTGGGAPVTLMPLASLIQNSEVDHVDILKIDVEGNEDKVLSPFLDTAPESLLPGAIIIEHIKRGDWRRDSIAEAHAKGYLTKFSTRNNTVLVRQPR